MGLRVVNVWFLLFLLAVGLRAQQNNPTSRFALVIGVQNYSGVAPLRHSIKDANDMSKALQSKGFKVETLIDPKTKKQIKDAITRYYNAMTQSSGAVGIIYYAGHGTQFEGENYLIPATASLQVPGDLDDQCVKMNLVMSVLNSFNNNLNIFLLDACRTNNFASFGRDIVKGLASVEAPKGSIVVFATQPGTVASDGTGSNGLFTSKLLKYIDEPNLNISEVLRKVKRDVNDESEGRQLPSVVDNSIGGEFYFNKATTNVAPVVENNASKQVASTVVKKEPEVKKPQVIKNEPNPVNTNPVNTKKITQDYGYGLSDATTVALGSQVWILKNLNVKTFTNGDAIPEAKSAKEWRAASDNKQPAWCYYKNDSSKQKVYGKLYNWYAVHDPRGLAPSGWHIPTDEEWSAMADQFKADPDAAKVIKAGSIWGNVGSNSSGLTFLPGGMRYPIGEFTDLGKNGYWWSATEKNDGEGGSIDLVDYNDLIHKASDYKGCGLSVRCIKD